MTSRRSLSNLVPLILSVGTVVVVALFVYGSTKLVVSARPSTPADQITWAQEVIRVGHNLVYYLWVVGAVLVTLVAAFASYFFAWAGQHRDILKSVDSWQKTVKRSESLILEAARGLPDPVFVNFKDSEVRRYYERRLAEMHPVASPEEIDTQIVALGVLTDVSSTTYIKLGNYFRYRGFVADPKYQDPRARADLWCALRRYGQARDRAEAEPGKRAAEMAGQASHGIAICLLRLDQYHQALTYAKDAVDKLKTNLSESYQPLVSYGIASIYLDKFPEAVEALTEAVSRVRFDVVANYNLACAYAKWGKNTFDYPTRTMRYTLALNALRAIVGKVGSARATLENIDTEPDFDGLRDSTLAGDFRSVVAELKAGN